jgi:hypothetical protein
VCTAEQSKGKIFTAFHSAAEEAEMKRGEQSWDNEGGQMSSIAMAGAVESRANDVLAGMSISTPKSRGPTGLTPSPRKKSSLDQNPA